MHEDEADQAARAARVPLSHAEITRRMLALLDGAFTPCIIGLLTGGAEESPMVEWCCNEWTRAIEDQTILPEPAGFGLYECAGGYGPRFLTGLRYCPWCGAHVHDGTKALETFAERTFTDG
jgi:hypothetical protein